jgi:type IV pilus assembly protein PilW
MKGIGNKVRGLGLVEILVALAIGLFLVAAAASFFVGQLSDHRRRLLDVRVTQELRAATALIERDLRRAGYWGAAETSLWHAGQASVPALNPYAAIHPSLDDSDLLGYSYCRDASDNGAVDGNERFGFRINANTRALEMRLAGTALIPADGDTWQPVTDPALVRVTRFILHTETRTLDLGARCTAACPAGASGCPPTQSVRLVTVVLEGRATTDASLQRALRSTLRLRADPVQGLCPAG